jgi:hypothetical protein
MKSYSRKITSPKCLALALLHNATSILIFENIAIGMEEMLRKIRVFLSFQRSQDVGIISETKDLCLMSWMLSKASHKSFSESKVGQRAVSIDGSPSQ